MRCDGVWYAERVRERGGGYWERVAVSADAADLTGGAKSKGPHQCH